MQIETFDIDTQTKTKRPSCPEAVATLDAFFEDINTGSTTDTPTALYFETDAKAVVITDIQSDDQGSILPLLDMTLAFIKHLTLHYVENKTRQEAQLDTRIVKWALEPVPNATIASDANARFLAALQYDVVYLVTNGQTEENRFAFDASGIDAAYQALIQEPLDTDALTTTAYQFEHGELSARRIRVKPVTHYEPFGFAD